MGEAPQDAVRVAVDALIAEDQHWGYQHRFGSGNGAAASFARAVVDALAAAGHLADSDLRERLAALAVIEEYIGEGCDNASHNIREVLKGDDPRPNADRWGLDYRALTETKGEVTMGYLSLQIHQADTDTPAVIDAAHLARQRAFSERTFGPGSRTQGVLDHIRKELAEIEADPTDVGEWVDVLILAFDGAWRAGHGPQQIIDAIVAKQARNEARTWPDWRTADPNRAIEHDRSGEQGREASTGR